MQETLAAARDDWRPATHRRGAAGGAECGSGTLAIEAGTHRPEPRAPACCVANYGFMHLKGLTTRREKRSAAKRSVPRKRRRIPRIIAHRTLDPDRGQGCKEKRHATAGVDHLIEFGVCATSPKPRYRRRRFLVVMNRNTAMRRMGEIAQLERSTSGIGATFSSKSARGLTGYVFTGNLDLAKKVHLTPSRKFPFFNADHRLPAVEVRDVRRLPPQGPQSRSDPKVQGS